MMRVVSLAFCAHLLYIKHISHPLADTNERGDAFTLYFNCANHYIATVAPLICIRDRLNDIFIRNFSTSASSSSSSFPSAIDNHRHNHIVNRDIHVQLSTPYPSLDDQTGALVDLRRWFFIWALDICLCWDHLCASSACESHYRRTHTLTDNIARIMILNYLFKNIILLLTGCDAIPLTVHTPRTMCSYRHYFVECCVPAYT